jgi:CMP-N-acetylneuraminic acid synthetase
VPGTVGLIPARGGSKGIPHKNIAELAGKPLLVWTIEAARGSEHVERVVVSTDAREIAAAARAAGAEVLERPAALASDDTPMLDVIRHAIDELDPEILVLLQPTSPLRRAEHIDAAVVQLQESGADVVVSVVAVPHQFAPASLVVLEGDRVQPVDAAAPLTRQEKRTAYARNGPAVLALRAGRLGDSLYGGDVRAYVMEPRDSLDVDAPDDLELAAFLLDRRGRDD